MALNLLFIVAVGIALLLLLLLMQINAPDATTLMVTLGSSSVRATSQAALTEPIALSAPGLGRFVFSTCGDE